MLMMDEDQATSITEAVGGDAWQSGGGALLVVLRTDDDGVITFSEECICEYKDEKAFEDGRARVESRLH